MDFDSFKVGFRDEKLSGWYSFPRRELYPGIEIRETDVVLDVGCGDGGVTHFCSRLASNVLFTDIDEDKVNATERRLRDNGGCPARGVVCDCNPILFDDEVADVVVCREVIEHVDNPAALLAELYRVGKPGARYLISAPDLISEELQIGIAAPQYFLPPNHIHTFSQEELQELLRSAGFDIVTTHTQGFYWTLWWLFFWNSGQELAPPWDPLLSSWAETWSRMLDTPNGPVLKEKLDALAPKSQVVVATKC